MLLNKVRTVCKVIIYIGFLNFLLFALVSLCLGGDALNGKVENGHYYLANHGRYTEVSYFVFMYSKIHGTSVFITQPLMLVAGFVYWLTGGDEGYLKGITNAIERPPEHPLRHGLYIGEAILWKAIDFIEGLFGKLLDSWRKPAIEFFTRLSKKECIVKLSEAIDYSSSLVQLERPVGGYLYGTHFCLFKRPAYRTFYRSAGTLVLTGEFVDTSHGTYVRAWHRFSTIVIIFVTLWLGGIIGFLSVILALDYVHTARPEVSTDWVIAGTLCVMLPMAVALITLSAIWLSSSVGQRENNDLAWFLRWVLKRME